MIPLALDLGATLDTAWWAVLEHSPVWALGVVALLAFVTTRHSDGGL
ncbi:MAG TPA: hypothetical protein VHH11_13970 [Gammaproteobacteria bacterium]|nr:hypothetical protein [Gammaproteobacteria bacterium]